MVKNEISDEGNHRVYILFLDSQNLLSVCLWDSPRP
jgi:hypothetical protein